MKYIRFVLLFNLVGILGSSCDLGTELELELPSGEPKLVVNCIVPADSAWTVLVFNSLPATVNDSDYHGTVVSNANVKIFEANAVIDFKLDTAAQGTLCYRSTTRAAQIGKTYTLEVSAPGYATVHSSVIIPRPVPLMNASMERLPPTGPLGQFERRLKISFGDPQHEQNFYAVTVTKQSYHQDWGWSLPQGQMPRPTDEVLTENFVIPDPFNGFTTGWTSPVFFNDQFFNGREYTLELGWSDSETSSGALRDREIRFRINLWSVSEEYYKYRLTLQKQKDQMKDPFAQPVQVYNNIENGFGAFGAYSQSEIVLEGVE